MSKKFRMYITTLYIDFQIGVSVIGLPDFHSHALIISKSVNEVDAKKYGLL
jgi:hypothetical protein